MNKNVDANIKPAAAKSPKLFRLIVIILIAILAINVLTFALKISRSTYYNEAAEYSELKHYLDEGDYPGLVKLVASNQAMNLKSVNDTSSFVYFSDFYEAAFLYKAYKDTGENEKAENALSEAKENMALITGDDFIDAVNDVKEMYGIDDTAE